MSNLVCPISSEKINEYVSRTTAGIVFSLLILFTVYQNIWFLVVALIDFLFRIFEKNSFSPVSAVVKVFFNITNLPNKPVAKAPKVFAARLGFLLSFLSFVIFFFSLTSSLIISGILSVCIFADVAFNYCIGCVIYHYFVFPFYKKKNSFKKVETD